jgi:hypothetical protein
MNDLLDAVIDRSNRTVSALRREAEVARRQRPTTNWQEAKS